MLVAMKVLHFDRILLTATCIFPCIVEGGSTILSTTAVAKDSLLRIHVPTSLAKDEGYDHRQALFGFPLEGGKLVANVYYADSDLCNQTVDTTKGYPARECDPSTAKMKPWPSPYILMVDRGNCSFVSKVRHAQHVGAAGVIIADAMCLFNEGWSYNSYDVPECQTGEPIMADDGSGGDISIPSFFMFWSDADRVKWTLKANEPVLMEMAWNIPRLDNVVECQLWLTPGDLHSKSFVKAFLVIRQALGAALTFSPHMYVSNGTASNCSGPLRDDSCDTLCILNGRYCATPVDNVTSGADVMVESLRRLCIWKLYGTSAGNGVEWWHYVSFFEERCNGTSFNAPTCVESALVYGRIDPQKVGSCMMENGELLDHLLDDELNSQKERGIVAIPAVHVNSIPLRESLSASNVFKAICYNYHDDALPDACRKCAYCPDPVICIQKGKCPTCSSVASIPPWMYVASLLVVGITTVWVVWIHRYTKPFNWNRLPAHKEC